MAVSSRLKVAPARAARPCAGAQCERRLYDSDSAQTAPAAARMLDLMRHTTRNLKNRRRMQKIRNRLAQQAKQEKKARRMNAAGTAVNAPT
jgi:hypothetical protein